jgi:hypothetical protein
MGQGHCGFRWSSYHLAEKLLEVPGELIASAMQAR